MSMWEKLFVVRCRGICRGVFTFWQFRDGHVGVELWFFFVGEMILGCGGCGSGMML